MGADQNLSYYTCSEPRRPLRGRSRVRALGKHLLGFLGFFLSLWFLGSIIVFVAFPMKCVDSNVPNAYVVSYFDPTPVCATNEFGSVIFGAAVISLVGALGFYVYTSLRITPSTTQLVLAVRTDGMESPYSRFPRPITGWADIESFGLYEDASGPSAGKPRRYLAVTVHSPDGLHDSAVLEAVWRRYPLVPDAERVAIMFPLELVYSDISVDHALTDMIQRIQTTFATEIAQHGVVVFESVRLV